MAKRRSQRRRQFTPRGVGVFSPARRDLDTFPIASYQLHRRNVLPLSVVEDFRRYHPHAKSRHFRDIRGSVVFPRHVLRDYSRTLAVSRSRTLRRRLRSMSFDPLRVLLRSAVLCAKRRIRREVIFARGSGGSRVRRPRRNENSKIICR